MNDPPSQKILVFTDENVEAQRSLERLFNGIFAPKGYEVLAYDLYQIRERKMDVGEIIDFVRPQTVLWQLSIPIKPRLEEFMNAERLKPPETRFILLSSVDESLIYRTLERRLHQRGKHEIVLMPFDMDELVKIVAGGEPRVEIEPCEEWSRGKERE